ncbi:hypothetical protein ABGB07_33930 [Micromonosporaceae bacterium B7E4]
MTCTAIGTSVCRTDFSDTRNSARTSAAPGPRQRRRRRISASPERARAEFLAWEPTARDVDFADAR